MLTLIKDTLTTISKVWPLVIVTLLIHIVTSFESALDLKNFGYTLLLMIPITLIGVFNFSLIKFIHDYKSKNPQSMLSESGSDYMRLIPQLFLRLIGSTLIFGIIMGVTAALVQYLIGAIGLDNQQPLFSFGSGLLNLKYVVYNLIITFLLSLFSFQAPLYFFAKVPFFRALLESIKLVQDHLSIILLITAVTFIVSMFSLGLVTENPLMKVASGILNGLDAIFTTVLIYHYFQTKVKLNKAIDTKYS